MCKECNEEKEIKTKVCKICGEEKPVSEFKSKRDKRNPELYRINYSKKCRLCEYLEKHPYHDLIHSNWSYDEYLILLDNILNSKINYLNDILEYLKSKTLKKCIDFIHINNLRFGSCQYNIKSNCYVCGKDIVMQGRKYNEENNCCSDDCIAALYSIKHSGENSHLYSSIKVTCDWCGSEVVRNPYLLKQNDHNFCNRECFRNWFTNIYVKTEKFIIRNREVMISNLTNGSIKTTNTSIQIIINNLLDKLNIKYENEKVFGYYTVDNYLKDLNLIIEVNGDFFHCNPFQYNKINYEIQVKRITQDKAKNSYIKRYHNINVLYLWECDINNNLELCEKLIVQYITQKGNLDNYNSFNYRLNNKNIELNDDIIPSYCECDNDYIKNKTDISIVKNKKYYIDFHCDYCGVEAKQLISYYYKYNTHFCSKDCFKNFKTDNKELRKCKYCGSITSNNIYCSKHCKIEDAKKFRINVICEKCKKEFGVKKSHYDRNKSKKFFCCKECYNISKQNKI